MESGSIEAVRDEGLRLEKSLLYVAVTRARKQVVITATEPRSEFLL